MVIEYVAAGAAARTGWAVLHDAGITWQKDRSWCQTGMAIRKRKRGEVKVHDPDASAKKA